MTPPTVTVVLSPDAENDLRSLHEYVTTTRSRDEADALLDRLVERVSSLEHFPLQGGIPKELDRLGDTEYRQLPLPPYRLIYYFEDSSVVVAVIADGRRDMAALLERRLLGR